MNMWQALGKPLVDTLLDILIMIILLIGCSVYPIQTIIVLATVIIGIPMYKAIQFTIKDKRKEN